MTNKTLYYTISKTFQKTCGDSPRLLKMMKEMIIIIIITSILSKPDEATAVLNHNFAFPGYRSEYLLCVCDILVFQVPSSWPECQYKWPLFCNIWNTTVICLLHENTFQQRCSIYYWDRSLSCISLCTRYFAAPLVTGRLNYISATKPCMHLMITLVSVISITTKNKGISIIIVIIIPVCSLNVT